MSERGGASAFPSSQRRGGATASGLARRGGEFRRTVFASLPLRLRPVGRALRALLCAEGNALRATVLFFVIIPAITLPLLPAAPAAPTRMATSGKLHGDWEAFSGMRRRAHLGDPTRRWSGGNTIFVQTGDFLDRGPKARGVMDLLMALQRDATRQSGRVIVLMGNHEAMNIFADLRYVADDDYASFADDKAKSRPKGVYPSRPAGYVERCEALNADGRYGKWLRTLPAMARLNDSIFLHGGISPELAGWTVDKINDAASGEIKAFDAYKQYLVEKKLALPCSDLDELTNAARAASEKAKGKDAETLKGFLAYGGWASMAENGPLWFRGFAQWTDAEGAPQVQRLTQAFAVARCVVGHTPQPGQIVSRFDGKAFLIDTGMLSSYVSGGPASALEIKDGPCSLLFSSGIEF